MVIQTKRERLLLIEVHDPGRPTAFDWSASRGGLRSVRWNADRYGVDTPLGTGKVVWAEFDLDRQRLRREPGTLPGTLPGKMLT